MDLLHQYLGNLSESTFSTVVLTVMQVILLKRTYYADGVFTSLEASKIRFRKSGIADQISTAHQKMMIIGVFFLKTFLPEVFCQPEQYLAEFVVSSQSRM